MQAALFTTCLEIERQMKQHCTGTGLNVSSDLVKSKI